MSGVQQPVTRNGLIYIKTHFCVCYELHTVLLCNVWQRRYAPKVLNLGFTFVRMRNLWHGPVTRWLPELRYLEGTEHDEDVAPTLDGTDGARRV